ncbi:DUF885 domain-containing protein [Streptomyces sp. NPDC096311]|uniref:DUF885 domain-containing protein n=1 Tax=Streptomyces sp. NPDC096311 TaxID=3366083 RepID=UPI0037FEADF8
MPDTDTDTSTVALTGAATTPRAVAEAHMDALVVLDPILGGYLGEADCNGQLPDYSPDGHAARAELARRTLQALDRAGTVPGATAESERLCARLLRERLNSELTLYDAGEHLRRIATLGSPLQLVRKAFTLAPTRTPNDWDAIRRRLDQVPAALRGYRDSLAAGLDHGPTAGPAAVTAVIGQLDTWIADEAGGFRPLASTGPEPQRPALTAAAARATRALHELSMWLRNTYAPRASESPDAVGRDRYLLWSRHHNGTDLDLEEAYAYGWSEYHRLLAEMRDAARQVLPDAVDPRQALEHLGDHGEAIEGAEQAREWLQSLTERTIEALDGVHFDFAAPVRRVETSLAPAGTTAAYYTGPSQDFARPGRTWLPVLGRSRFPVHDLVSTWYHEGVPGHHLQVAQWTHVAATRLTRFQASAGVVNGNVEGWALYAERLMDELGFFHDPAHRLGYLQAQMQRTMRLVVDIGMHLRLRIPADAPYGPGQRWTPEVAGSFLRDNHPHPGAFVDSEVVRYLSLPGQAIGYKLGERQWLRGREAARARRGAGFDAKSWHMAALSQGSLGLDDLVEELARL